MNQQIQAERDAARYEDELERIARGYRAEGFATVIHPTPGQLPPFVAGDRVDILATRADVNALMRVVRNRFEIPADPSMLRLSEAARAHPGWRFDWEILGWPPPLPWPEPAQLEAMLAEAEAAPSRAGLLLAWAAGTAVMRRLSRRGTKDPVVLLNELYSEGPLPEDEFRLLCPSLRLRDAVANGDAEAIVGPADVRVVTEAARKLLAEPEQPQAAA